MISVCCDFLLFAFCSCDIWSRNWTHVLFDHFHFAALPPFICYFQFLFPGCAVLSRKGDFFLPVLMLCRICNSFLSCFRTHYFLASKSSITQAAAPVNRSPIPSPTGLCIRGCCLKRKPFYTVFTQLGASVNVKKSHFTIESGTILQRGTGGIIKLIHLMCTVHIVSVLHFQRKSFRWSSFLSLLRVSHHDLHFTK